MKMKMKKINLILIIVLALVFLAAAFFIVKNFTGNVVKDESKKEIWLENNCECIERENLKCPEGFELPKDGGLCEKIVLECKQPSGFLHNTGGDCERKLQYTFSLKGCSKYQCEDGVYKVK